MATITIDEVEQVADLARLEFNDAELQTFTGHLDQILTYIGKLNELDTDEVPPTSHAIEIRNVTKPDVVKASYDREAVLENAPAEEAGYFEVPKVIE